MGYSEEDIMNPNTNKTTVILASDSVFINSKCLFVEYNDVIKSPLFPLMYLYIEDEELNEYFDFSSVIGITPEEMCEFYLNRRYINPLYNFPLNSRISPEDGMRFADDVVRQSFDISNSVYSDDMILNFAVSLSFVLKDPNFIKDCRVYSEDYHKFIEEDLQELYGKRVTYVYGDFKEAIKTVPQDSTYVLSDISKVQIISDEDKLKLNTILLADNYAYNYDINGNYKIDMVKLSENCPYKFSTFDNIRTKKLDPLKINEG